MTASTETAAFYRVFFSQEQDEEVADGVSVCPIVDPEHDPVEEESGQVGEFLCIGKDLGKARASYSHYCGRCFNYWVS